MSIGKNQCIGDASSLQETFPLSILCVISIITVLILCCFTSAAAVKTKPPTQITSIAFAAANQQTTLLIDFTGEIPAYKIFSLANPPRLIIDLPHATILHPLQNLDFTGTPILHARTGHPHANSLRLVFDLDETVHPEAFLQKIPHQTTQKLIIDFSFKKIAKPVPVASKENMPNQDLHQPASPANNLQQTKQWVLNSLPQGTSAPSPLPLSHKWEKEKSVLNTAPEEEGNYSPDTTSDAAIKETATSGTRLINIIIDPGHGGKDPGTTGPLGVHEKDVVLAISKDLRAILAKQPGFHPVLTRNSDYFIPLRGRLALARKYKGDLFIAIHADAYQDPYASGASVYALSAHGASTEAARWLAEKENYSELGGINLTDKSDMLRSVLLDLSQTATVASSMQLGSNLLQQLNTIGQLHYKVVEQAPFMVLKSPDIPSVLVETGFLSNTEEEERLRNPFDQVEIAQALAKGIENYFWKNPPPGTLVASLAAHKNKITYE